MTNVCDLYSNDVRRSYTFPSKGSRSNVSPRDKLIKKKKMSHTRSKYFSLWSKILYHRLTKYITRNSGNMTGHGENNEDEAVENILAVKH